MSKYFKCKKNVKSLTANKEYSGSEAYSSQASDDTEKNDISVNSISDSVLGSSKSDSDKQLNEDKESDSGMKYLQILFYYVQDASLFKVHLPVIGSSSESWLIHFLQFSPEVLLIYTNITEMCFVENTTAAMKVLFTSLFGPFVMFILLLIYLFSKVLKKCYKTDALLLRLCQAFILVVLLSYQKVMQGAFLLVQCVTLRDHEVLHIDANVTCFTWWQTVCEFYLGTCVIPVFLVLAFGPYLVEKRKLSVAMFVLACILPLPVAFCLLVFEILVKGKLNLRTFDHKHCSNSSDDNNYHSPEDGNSNSGSAHIETDYSPDDGNSKSGSDDTENYHSLDDQNSNSGSDDDENYHSLDDGNSNSGSDDDENYHSLDDQNSNSWSDDDEHYHSLDNGNSNSWSDDDEHYHSLDNGNSNSRSDYNQCSESEKVITEHLLKHYKALKICGVPMTWLAFHKLYRMSLIWCHTYITEPLPRLSAMSVLAILVTFITIFVKPYKETTANNIAILSHAASVCISVINIVKSTLIVGNYDPNELVRTMVKYFDLCEVILLTWIPVVAIALWLLYTIAKISKSKIKGKDHETV